MDWRELIQQRDKLRKEVVWDPDIERALIEEATRAGVDVMYFKREYIKAKEALRGFDPVLYKEGDHEDLRKDLLTITIVNAYETIRSENKKE
ncbi:MAG TPA: hypothetical protein VMV95_01885 [Bacillota bacterium]|nr:hypothetical protein [Bacillota bacterium]